MIFSGIVYSFKWWIWRYNYSILCSTSSILAHFLADWYAVMDKFHSDISWNPFQMDE